MNKIFKSGTFGAEAYDIWERLVERHFNDNDGSYLVGFAECKKVLTALYRELITNGEEVPQDFLAGVSLVELNRKVKLPISFTAVRYLEFADDESAWQTVSFMFAGGQVFRSAALRVLIDFANELMFCAIVHNISRAMPHNRKDIVVGFRLRRSRTALGWSREDLAEDLDEFIPGVTADNIAAWENGEKILPFAEMVAFCKTLNVSVYELTDERFSLIDHTVGADLTVKVLWEHDILAPDTEVLYSYLEGIRNKMHYQMIVPYEGIVRYIRQRVALNLLERDITSDVTEIERASLPDLFLLMQLTKYKEYQPLILWLDARAWKRNVPLTLAGPGPAENYEIYDACIQLLNQLNHTVLMHRAAKLATHSTTSMPSGTVQRVGMLNLGDTDETK